MQSAPDDRNGSSASELAHQQVLLHFHGNLAERLDIQQMFVLIDGVLPFEACLYHQVLPLYLEGTRLVLGMVSLEDTAAADYVRRIIAYHNYRLVPRAISSEALQAALSAYLNYSRQQANKGVSDRPASKTNRYSSRSRSEQKTTPEIQPTLVVDSPEDLEDVVSLTFRQTEPQISPLEPPSTSTPSEDAKPTQIEEVSSIPSEHSGGPSSAETLNDHPLFEEPTPSKIVSPPFNAPQPLKVKKQHLHQPASAIINLPPSELLQELLGRVLVGGIGRLYFERQSKHGRILCSQSGVLQSVLDGLDLGVFQGVVNELKRLAQLSQLPIEHTKQAEIERLYEGELVMLRFRFMRGSQGEEATLQVLRGAALRFYQQQQLATLERDALRIAKQLQSKLNEIRDRTRIEAKSSTTKLEALPALSQLLKSIEAQLNSMKLDETMYDDQGLD